MKTLKKILKGIGYLFLAILVILIGSFIYLKQDRTAGIPSEVRAFRSSTANDEERRAILEATIAKMEAKRLKEIADRPAIGTEKWAADVREDVCRRAIKRQGHSKDYSEFSGIRIGADYTVDRTPGSTKVFENHRIWWRFVSTDSGGWKRIYTARCVVDDNRRVLKTKIWRSK